MINSCVSEFEGIQVVLKNYVLQDHIDNDFDVILQIISLISKSRSSNWVENSSLLLSIKTHHVTPTETRYGLS